MWMLKVYSVLKGNVKEEEITFTDRETCWEKGREISHDDTVCRVEMLSYEPKRLIQVFHHFN